jgi:hypothetical protein
MLSTRISYILFLVPGLPGKEVYILQFYTANRDTACTILYNNNRLYPCTSAKLQEVWYNLYSNRQVQQKGLSYPWTGYLLGNIISNSFVKQTTRSRLGLL